MTTEQKVAEGTNVKELRELADNLVAHKTDMGIEWRNDGDRERYAEILRKSADLIEISPNITLAAGLETKYVQAGCHKKRPPMLVVGHTTVAGTKSLSDRRAAVEKMFAHIELLERQIESFCDEIGASKVGLLCSLLAQWAQEAEDHVSKNNIRFEILSELSDLFAGYVQLTEKGEKNHKSYMRAKMLLNWFGLALLSRLQMMTTTVANVKTLATSLASVAVRTMTTMRMGQASMKSLKKSLPTKPSVMLLT